MTDTQPAVEPDPTGEEVDDEVLAHARWLAGVTERFGPAAPMSYAIVQVLDMDPCVLGGTHDKDDPGAEFTERAILLDAIAFAPADDGHAAMTRVSIALTSDVLGFIAETIIKGGLNAIVDSASGGNPNTVVAAIRQVLVTEDDGIIDRYRPGGYL